MNAPETGSRIIRGFTARTLTVLYLLCAVGLSAAPAVAQSGMPGRILTSSGGGAGGVIALNPDVTNVVNLSANTFDSTCLADDGQHKSIHPSASRDGRLIAFASSRDGSGRFRIVLMNSDGTGVRQLTTGAGAALPNGTLADDTNPVISPDGSRVAFISQRNSTDVHTYIRSIFVVNTDGSGGLRQVTFAQTDTSSCNNNCFNGHVYSVAWNPDGTRLAFRGTRLAADNSGVSPNFHSVVGLVNADGTGEATLAVLDSTEEIGGIDWSPDGRHIGAPQAGVGQQFRLILFDLQAGGSREILQSAAQTGGFNFNAGGFRFSPDGQRLAYTTGHPQLVVTDLNGAELSRANVPTSFLTPLWWQAGAAVPAPDRLGLIPNPIILRAGGPRVQLQPTLFDAAGNVISRAASSWTCNTSFNVFVSSTGLARPDTNPATFSPGQLCASNGGRQACATVHFNPATNRSDEPEVFTSYQYFDFLNRTPDPPGLAFWTGNITECGANAQCVQVKRIHTSAAFFLSIEFQETGFLVYRLYKAAFGDLPGKPVPLRREEFLPDTQKIGEGVVVNQGDWQARLGQNKQEFVAAFVARPRFTAAYPANMMAAEFVDKLNQNAGSPLDAAERSQLINELGPAPGDAQKRASVLRKVAEDQTLKDAEFRRAFVLMQYFGYLRRNPDDAPDTDFSGWQFWLGKLNEFQGDFIRAEMVKAFLDSIEYRQRFGQ